MKTKEDKIIEKHTDKLESFQHQLGNEVFVSSYSDLLEEYKKLSKRFVKTMKINDMYGLSVLKEGEALKDKVNSTVKIAKEKLLGKISEQRETKEEYEKQLQEAIKTIKMLQMQLAESNQKLVSFTSKHLSSSIQLKQVDSISEINFAPYNTQTLEEVILKEKNLHGSLIVGKLTIDNMKEIVPIIQKTSTINGFYKAILRYLNTTFGNDVIVFYADENLFYIISHKSEMEEFQSTILKLNNNKKFNGISLYFNFGFIVTSSSESFDSIIMKCDTNNQKASLIDKENCQVSIVHD